MQEPEFDAVFRISSENVVDTVTRFCKTAIQKARKLFPGRGVFV